jgi:hypothetical protein
MGEQTTARMRDRLALIPDIISAAYSIRQPLNP